jgi:phage terminase large subunit-like protein
MLEARWRAVLAALKGMETAPRRRLLAGMAPSALRSLEEEWAWQALRGQREPPTGAGAGSRDWRVWLIMAGRGFGKTRAGAEWVWARAREIPEARIALVGGTLDEVARVMVEGESGLIRCARRDEDPVWRPSRGELLFPSGAVAQAFSGCDPARLRGPQHHFAWCDELAKWPRAEAVWDNLMLGMRVGERPRTIVTTTPASVAILKRIAAEADTAVTRGRTHENPHLPETFLAAMDALYGGTRLGRQELEGVLFDDVAGALWTRASIEACRERGGMGWAPAVAGERLRRIVVGVDPPATADGDACGIVVCGMDDGGTAWVLADCSAAGLSPAGWARKVAGAAEAWGADRVVAEKNNGGDMVGSTLAGVDANLAVRLVSASRGKAARAEPICGRFEAGKARFAGCFPDLEDELCGITSGGGYEGPGRSPDRADAMVWAMTELFRPQPEPRVRGF